MESKNIAGNYDPDENVLHMWYPRRVELNDEASVREFFEEVLRDWVKPCPRKPYALIDYRNVQIAPAMASVYAASVEKMRPWLLGTYRYVLAPDFTGVTVALGNLRLQEDAHIFPD